jgi:hypothetical protein
VYATRDLDVHYMARKKKSRLTHKKKSTSNNPDKAPPEGLPRTQFAALELYGSFIGRFSPFALGHQHNKTRPSHPVEDAEGEHTTFRKDDTYVQGNCDVTSPTEHHSELTSNPMKRILPKRRLQKSTGLQEFEKSGPLTTQVTLRTYVYIPSTQGR